MFLHFTTDIPCLNVSVPLPEEKECGLSLRALTVVKNRASESVNVCAGECVGVWMKDRIAPPCSCFYTIYNDLFKGAIYDLLNNAHSNRVFLRLVSFYHCCCFSSNI